MPNLGSIRASVYTGLAETSGASFTDSEIDKFVNEEYRFLQAIISSFNEEYFAKRSTFKSSDTEKWGLPSDFLKMLLLEIKVQDVWMPVNEVPLHSLESYSNGPGTFLAVFKNISAVVYSLVDRCIIVKPNPGASAEDNMRMTYLPVLAQLVDDGDTPLIPELYHELLNIGPINRAREALKEPPINADRYRFLLNNLEETSTPRVRKSPKQVRMVRGMY